MRPLLVLASCFAFAANFASAAGSHVSGPMLGYQTHREVLVWVETRDAAEVALTFHRADDPGSARTVTRRDPPTTPAGVQPIKFVLPLLDMGASYVASLSIDGQPVELPEPLTFKTAAQFEWRGAAPDFSFLFGSCAYLNDPPYDRPGKPYGAGNAIFTPMADSGADFMLWGGDNLYLREADFSSDSGIWYRYSRDRATPELQPLLARMHHYATWDDHDFGPNNSNRSYDLKDTTLAAFNAYWGNRTAGERDNPGVYHRFQWADAVFLVLDNRYHRDESSIDGSKYPKSQYGRRQLEWLKQQLAGLNEGGARRHTPLRFIVTGGQFLSENDYPGAEGHVTYAEERAELLQFIRDHKIGGVVFLSGDVHYTELTRREDLLPYPLYELTSSPLTSGAHTRSINPSPGRLAETVVQEQNYCQVFVSGPPKDRTVTLRCHDRAGALKWEHTFKVADLAWPQ